MTVNKDFLYLFINFFLQHNIMINCIEGTLMGENFGKEIAFDKMNFGKLNLGLYSYFSCYGEQLAGKTLVNF